MRAQVRLSPRLRNQQPLQTKELVSGVKGADGVTCNVVPLAEAASCADICASSSTVVLPESGMRVL
jgi:hypothetical protein